MDPIKEAFHSVKEDINFLNKELLILKNELNEARQEMMKIVNILKNLTQKTDQDTPIRHQKYQKSFPTHLPAHPAQNHEKQTIPAHNPTHPTHFNKGNQGFSTGNEGVPTDRQTDRQTDRHTQNIQKQPIFQQKYMKNSIEDAVQILDSLDSLKKEIRLKFKQLTDQEILVFSTLYQMEEEQGPIDYRTLAAKLGLTESSIRDYIGRLLKKGIPIEKKRVNNKQILLSISENLKKVASLSTILQLRDM